MIEMIRKIKIKKENIYIFLLLVIALVLYYSFANPNILFAFNIIMMLYILFRARISFFSIRVILCNYILFATFSEYNFDMSYGLLHLEDNLYFDKINILIFIYDFFILLVLTNSNIIELEHKQLNKKYEISKITEYIFGIIAVIATLIALPSLPFQDDYARFDALLPGNAWNHIAMVALIFMIPNIKKSKFCKVIYAFVIFWFLSHYERVDIIGMLILIVIILYKQKERKIKIKNIIVLVFVIFAIIFSMIAIGEKRAGNNSTTLSNLVKKVLVQNTACDVAYVFNSAIDYNNSHQLLYGKTYVTYLVKALPFLDTNERTDFILQNEYATAGGDFLLDEPLMNFGIVGVVIYPILEMLIYYFILKKQTRYRFILWSFLIMSVFRTTWYGLYYIEKGIIYFIPIMYFLLYFIERKGKNNEKSIDF